MSETPKKVAHWSHTKDYYVLYKRLFLKKKNRPKKSTMSLVLRSFNMKIRQKHPERILNINLKLLYLINLVNNIDQKAQFTISMILFFALDVIHLSI